MGGSGFAALVGGSGLAALGFLIFCLLLKGSAVHFKRLGRFHIASPCWWDVLANRISHRNLHHCAPDPPTSAAPMLIQHPWGDLGIIARWFGARVASPCWWDVLANRGNSDRLLRFKCTRFAQIPPRVLPLCCSSPRGGIWLRSPGGGIWVCYPGGGIWPDSPSGEDLDLQPW